MKYTIISGCFEKGTSEQQAGYVGLFGQERIGYYFDLYFHWYNLVHEIGHCIVEKQGAVMSKVREEMFVNELAVGFYRAVGESGRLDELREKLEQILGSMPAPMPEGEAFTDFYERIWGSDLLNNVMIYGYFQLNSVLMALRSARDFRDVMKEIGVEIGEGFGSTSEIPGEEGAGSTSIDTASASIQEGTGEWDSSSTSKKTAADINLPGPLDIAISSENAPVFFDHALSCLRNFGIDLSEIRLELVDNPMIQCARSE